MDFNFVNSNILQWATQITEFRYVILLYAFIGTTGYPWKTVQEDISVLVLHMMHIACCVTHVPCQSL